jgi:hypothetical protein
MSAEAWVNFSGTRRYADVVDKGINDTQNLSTPRIKYAAR